MFASRSMLCVYLLSLLIAIVLRMFILERSVDTAWMRVVCGKRGLCMYPVLVNSQRPLLLWQPNRRRVWRDERPFLRSSRHLRLSEHQCLRKHWFGLLIRLHCVSLGNHHNDWKSKRLRLAVQVSCSVRLWWRHIIIQGDILRWYQQPSCIFSEPRRWK